MQASNAVNSTVSLCIAVAVTEDGSRVSGHAGQARQWLLFGCTPGSPAPQATRVTLTREQLPHHFLGDGPHPLKGAHVIIAASAGDGFIRHLASWGAQVLLTGETDPQAAVDLVLAGAAQPGTRFDITTALCKVRDLFSRA